MVTVPPGWTTAAPALAAAEAAGLALAAAGLEAGAAEDGAAAPPPQAASSINATLLVLRYDRNLGFISSSSNVCGPHPREPSLAGIIPKKSYWACFPNTTSG